jgi:hypothetical protein
MENSGRFFYHITAIENWEKIKADSLRPNKDNHVFAQITDARDVIREVALNQVSRNESH